MHDRYGPLVSFLLILTTAAIGSVILCVAPSNALIPVHFSRGWIPDNFVSPPKGLVIWVGLQLGLWALMYAAPSVIRSSEGFHASVALYDTAWITLTSMLGIIAIASMEQALGIKIAMASLIDVLMGGFLIVVGNGLGKIRPNALVGIRTPWTKANPRVWDRTHRAAGPIFILAGILLVAAGFGMFGVPAGSHFRAVCILGTALFSVGLSWLYWRAEQKQR